MILVRVSEWVRPLFQATLLAARLRWASPGSLELYDPDCLVGGIKCHRVRRERRGLFNYSTENRSLILRYNLTRGSPSRGAVSYGNYKFIGAPIKFIVT